MPFTPFVFGNEMAYSLIETDMTPWRASLGGERFTPDSYIGLRRYQLIGVKRGDRISLWVHDMGPAKNFDFGALEILCLWEETVEWAQEKATEIRENDAASARSFIEGRQQQLKEQWPKMAERQQELLQLNIANRSVFGSALNVQRNAFARVRKERSA